MASTHEQEQEFHDAWAESIDPSSVEVIRSFEAATCPETRWIVTELGDLRGKRVLELGSGAGEGSTYFALKGAHATATDLSPKMLDVCRRVAARHGVSIDTQVCSAEDLSCFPAGSFDIVYAANTLHHVDLESCLREVRRVLRPEGKFAFWDPLAYNPVINVYRRMASQVRTPDEHPLRRCDVQRIREVFPELKTRHFWLTALAVFLKFYLVDRIHPNADRYWKRIVTHEGTIRGLYRPLAAIDRVLLRVLFPLRWWCWNVAGVARLGGSP